MVGIYAVVDCMPREQLIYAFLKGEAVWSAKGGGKGALARV